MKIFLSGATGVIGTRVIPLLVKKGHSVTAATRSTRKAGIVERLGAEPREVDLFDPAKVASVVKGHDVVINLATSVPPSSRALMPGAWRETGRVRRYVSANLAKAARETDAQRLIQESFAPIYADAGDEWITETSTIKPARYNRTVVDAERAAATFATGGGVGIVLRFGFFYGPDSDFTRDAINMVRKGWAPALGSPGGFISSVSHDDAATAVAAAVDAAGGTYNVVDDDPLTKRDFYDSLADALGVAPPKFLPPWVRYLTGSVGATLGRSQRISNSRLRSAGWAPKVRSAKAGWPLLLRQLPSG
ncbi:MAG TPA: NAD(P)-dependent oxidoreductase [Gemmatimonadaceae bacterium]|nr:NAD(P)-dependent oxidoreductase [Gemmatimonadaceae bacterium]